MKHKDDELDDLIWYEAGLDEDGLDYWTAFGEEERRKRDNKRGRKKAAPEKNGTDKEFSPLTAFLLITLAFALLMLVKNR